MASRISAWATGGTDFSSIETGSLGVGIRFREFPTTLTLAYFSLITLFFLLFLEHVGHAPHLWAFSLLRPGSFLPQISTWVSFSIPSEELCSDVTFSEMIPNYAWNHLPHLLLPFVCKYAECSSRYTNQIVYLLNIV